jgi:SAM-dependent methyltransferase
MASLRQGLARAPAVDFAEFDPAPPAPAGALAPGAASRAVMAIAATQEFLFVSEAGAQIHRYELPDHSDILNCGGYIDKLLKYRDPALAAHIRANGVTPAAFADPRFPLLATRSPQIDLLILRALLKLLGDDPERRVRIFDLGCTVAEHYDLLALMLEAASQGKFDARRNIQYAGLDVSALALAAARALHADLPPEAFGLILQEGSAVRIPEGAYDLSLSIGVIHNLKEPVEGTIRLLNGTSFAASLACWVCAQDEGVWLTSHHAAPMYVFGGADLRRIEAETGMALLVGDFVPERASTQQRHFAEVSEAALETLGCYHLLTVRDPAAFGDLPRLKT